MTVYCIMSEMSFCQLICGIGLIFRHVSAVLQPAAGAGRGRAAPPPGRGGRTGGQTAHHARLQRQVSDPPPGVSVRDTAQGRTEMGGTQRQHGRGGATRGVTNDYPCWWTGQCGHSPEAGANG